MPGFLTSCLDCICFCCRPRKDPSDEQFRKGKEALERFTKWGAPNDLDNAIGYFDLALNNRRTSLDGSGPPHPDLDVTLTTYASALFQRYQLKQSVADLQRVIGLDEEAFRLYENASDAHDRPPEYTKLLLNLGDSYFHLYKDTHAAGSFDKSIEKYNQLRQSLNATSELKRKAKLQMGIALRTWCDKEESAAPRDKKKRLEQAIELFGETMDAAGKEKSAEKSDESSDILEKCLYNLAVAHNERYLIEKDLSGLGSAIVDLDKAIQYNRDAREMLLKSRHPELIFCLFDLAQQLFDKYNIERTHDERQTLLVRRNNGRLELEEAKRFAKEALSLPEINEDRHARLKADLEELSSTAEEHSQHSRQTSQVNLNSPQTLVPPAMAHTHSSNVSLATTRSNLTGSKRHSPPPASTYSNQVVDG